jgi:hypothetical protein
MNPTDASVIVANLDLVLPEQEKALQQGATNAGTYRNSNSALFSAFTQLQFFVLAVDYDMRVMVRTLLADPQSRLTAEKFLALVLEESDESIGSVIGDTKKALRAAAEPQSTDPARAAFDQDRFDTVTAAYWEGVRSIRDDKAFNKTLREIRNTVAGHYLGKQDGMLNSAAWVTSRARIPRTAEGAMTSAILLHSVTALTALLTYSRGLQSCVRFG